MPRRDERGERDGAEQKSVERQRERLHVFGKGAGEQVVEREGQSGEQADGESERGEGQFTEVAARHHDGAAAEVEEDSQQLAGGQFVFEKHRRQEHEKTRRGVVQHGGRGDAKFLHGGHVTVVVEREPDDPDEDDSAELFFREPERTRPGGHEHERRDKNGAEKEPQESGHHRRGAGGEQVRGKQPERAAERPACQQGEDPYFVLSVGNHRLHMFLIHGNNYTAHATAILSGVQ